MRGGSRGITVLKTNRYFRNSARGNSGYKLSNVLYTYTSIVDIRVKTRRNVLNPGYVVGGRGGEKRGGEGRRKGGEREEKGRRKGGEREG